VDLQATAPSPTTTRAEEHIAETPDCRPRAPDAKARGRCLENFPGPAAPTTGSKSALRDDEETLMMKKPFAWVSQGALGTNLASPGLQIAYLEVK